MAETSRSDVSTAFAMLLGEIQAEVDATNAEGARAFGAGDYAAVDAARRQAGALGAFRDKVVALSREWAAMADAGSAAGRRNLGRLHRGQRTPEGAYRIPILRVLVGMGGRGRTQEVLERVFALMQPSLRDVDLRPLSSDPEMPRWRNAARWSRNEMRKEGLLRADSPRGTWEISEAGREYLRQNG